ncbi:MAG: acetyl esterase/lipase [Rhodothermales bacterium]|jgi:acetyl esterase/lipase
MRVLCVFGLLGALCVSAAEPQILNVWPSTPPGDENVTLQPEMDTTKQGKGLVAGKRLIRLGNVSIPQLMIYRPAAEIATGTAMIIAPGGGYNILALDLEGTEVAEWLSSIGVTAIVLKYRVPKREGRPAWEAAVQDCQRAVSLARHNAVEWKINPERIGIMGFSAGGNAAGRTGLASERFYTPVDEADKTSAKPNFVGLVYPAYFVPKGGTELSDDTIVTADAPPMFFVHAHDDRIPSLSSVLLYAELKRHGVAGELHVFAQGGHGYGMRPTDLPVTHWPKQMAAWLRGSGWLTK